MTSGPQPQDLDHSKPGWYLELTAPRWEEKTEGYAWLDPSRLYMFPDAMKACTEDLVRPFEGDQIDIVAGLDAMGFVLGTSIANRLGKGFLTIRKQGKICTPTVAEKYSNYLTKGDEKIVMEIRKNPFPKGTRVLIVDQWIETGGTMAGATRLIEKVGGIVAGAAVIAVEESEGSKAVCSKYKVVHCVPPELQLQLNALRFDSFSKFDWVFK